MAFEKKNGVVHEFGLFEGSGSHEEKKIEKLFDKFGSLKGLKNLLRYVLVRSFGIDAGMFMEFGDIGVNYFFLGDPRHESPHYLAVEYDVDKHRDPEGGLSRHPAAIYGSAYDSSRDRAFNFRFEEAYNYDTGDHAYEIRVEERELEPQPHKPEYYPDV